jgi:hypothetical protein
MADKPETLAYARPDLSRRRVFAHFDLPIATAGALQFMFASYVLFMSDQRYDLLGDYGSVLFSPTCQGAIYALLSAVAVAGSTRPFGRRWPFEWAYLIGFTVGLGMTVSAILTSHAGGGGAADPAVCWQWTLVALIANPALLLLVVRRARRLL